MKKKTVFLGLFALTALGLFAQTALSGTYSYDNSFHITFSGNSFTGAWGSAPMSGTCTVSGSTLTLRLSNGVTWNWTIVNANTLRDQDGDNWVKDATSDARSDFATQLWYNMLYIDDLIAAYDPESHFRVNQIDGGRAVEIVEYVGRNTAVRIPPSIGGRPVTRIEDGFAYNNLTSVIIPNSVTAIGVLAFTGNRLTSVIIPNSVLAVEHGAFQNNELTSVTIGNSVTEIGGMAFYGNRLSSVTIPNSVTIIEGAAFAENRLTSITIGANVSLYNFESHDGSMVPPFDGNFVHVYNNGGKRAGTYILRNGSWVRQ